MKLLDGKKTALKVRDTLSNLITQLTGRKPGLAFILVGHNPASQIYVRAKQKACQTVGIASFLIELPEQVTENELLKEIQQLNEDPHVDGILVQLPLPSHISDAKVMLAIDPNKDVDGFHPLNMGKTLLGEEDGFLPCTPSGIKTLLEYYEIPLKGKHVVILGRSNIVGKPLAAMLVQKKEGCNATVTLAHRETRHLDALIKTADILVSAMGVQGIVKEHMVKEGVIAIDVGIHRLADGTLAGDLDFDKLALKAEWITPVPGGVGPMTIAMLLKNTYVSYQRALQ